MKREISFLLLALAVCVLFVGSAFAAEAQKDVTGQKEQSATQSKQMQEKAKSQAEQQRAGKELQAGAMEKQQRSSQIVGMTVTDTKGEKLGKIDELILSPQGCAQYALLAHGGLLGIGDKLVPIPWKSLKLSDDGKVLAVNMDKQALEKAPNFDRRQIPDLSAAEWQSKLQYHEQKTMTETEKGKSSMSEAEKRRPTAETERETRKQQTQVE